MAKEKKKKVRGNLSVKECFSAALRGLRYHVVFLAILMLFYILSGTAFIFLFTYQFSDTDIAQVKECYEQGDEMVKLSPAGQTYYWSIYGLAWGSTPDVEDRQRDTIREYTGGALSTIYSSAWLEFDLQDHFAEDVGYDNLQTSYQKTAYVDFESILAVDPETGMQDTALTVDERFLDPSLCSLPQKYMDIAITDLKLDAFIMFGYKDADGNTYEISTPDDMIGKKLGDYTVCGVFSTEEDILEYREKYDVVSEKTGIISGLRYVDFGIIRTRDEDGFAEAYYEETGNEINHLWTHTKEFFIRLSGDISTDKKLLGDLSYISLDSRLYCRSMTIESKYSSSLSTGFLRWFAEPATILLVVVVICYVIVAAVLLILFRVYFSLNYKQRDAGSDMGTANWKDMRRIGRLQCLFVSVGILVLTIVGICIVGAVANSFTGISVFTYGWVQLVFSLIICVLLPMWPAGSAAKSRYPDPEDEEDVKDEGS